MKEVAAQSFSKMDRIRIWIVQPKRSLWSCIRFLEHASLPVWSSAKVIDVQVPVSIRWKT